VKREAEDQLDWWRTERRAMLASTLRLSSNAQSYASALSLVSYARRRIDREQLLLVGQAEELGITWAAPAEVLATTPQNAHKDFSRRLMQIRSRVAEGWTVEEAIDTPTARTVPAGHATARRSGSATVCRRSTADASRSADGPASCPPAATTPTAPTGRSSDHHVPRTVIIYDLDPLSQQALA
jgi:hypothetical protein